MASIRRIAVRTDLPAATAIGDHFPIVRFGTMVTSPNFRHPVTLAKELMALDDMSGGRITLGIGSGGPGSTRWCSGRRSGRRGSGRTGSGSSWRCWTSC